MGAMQAQEVIQLGEARISYNPDAIVVNSDLNSVDFTVKENYIGEFSKNPIQFMKQNFDFKGFLSALKNAKEERKATYSCERKSDNINRTSSNNSNIVNFSRSNNHNDIRAEWIVYKS